MALWLRLATIQHNTAYPDILMMYCNHSATQSSNRHAWGWDQLYQGHLFVNWAKINCIHPNLQQSGTQVLISIMQTI